MDNLTGILEIGTFETNSKAINTAYEEYVLSVGDFDERIFLGDEAHVEIGTPGNTAATGELAESMQAHRSRHGHFEVRYNSFNMNSQRSSHTHLSIYMEGGGGQQMA